MSALIGDADGIYVDATFGRGGHSRAILGRLGASGRLVALDRDPAAIEVAHGLSDQRFTIVHSRFGDLGSALAQAGVSGGLGGILLDLGVSSPQLDTPERGFSFSSDGPLDMRMDPTVGESAAQWLAHADEDAIVRVLHEYGEERFARRIARAIIASRVEQPLLRTSQLASLIAQAVPTREPGKHPATRSFQALRIQVNEELEDIQRCLTQVCDLLGPGGRLVVISFHSLEDRIVKRFMRGEARGAVVPKGVPVRSSDLAPGRLRVVGKAVRPAAAELALNPRARSAIMRVAERST